MKKLLLICFMVFSISSFVKAGNKTVEVDICIYGGSSAGIIAGYTANKLGKKALVIEPRNYLGGLTTGGLGATDIGNKFAITGLARDFYRRLGAEYNRFEQWTFEPHVASKVFNDYIQAAKLDIEKNYLLEEVIKEGNTIKEIVVRKNDASNQQLRIKAKMFIDCTYEGDLMAKAGVSYAVGREAISQYGESQNGVQLQEIHQFPDGIDPYKIPGKPESGLLWGISNEKLAPHGSADKKIQAYNFRLTLTQDKSNQIPFTKPDNYNPEQFELLLRQIAKEKWTTIFSNLDIVDLPNGEKEYRHTGGFLIKYMPNGKTDFNNFGAFSTDMIGENYDYPEGDFKTREAIWKKHEDYTKRLLYFLSHDERVPAHIRAEMKSWGFCKDEFKETNGFSNQLYVREARRMIGRKVMTQKHCEGEEVIDDPIGMAAYQMDSHNIQRLVVNGMVKNEGDVQKPVPAPYPISYQAITPKAEECSNLLVPVCMSSSHIAFGSIRMEPVFMVLAQSAATAATQAIDNKQSVQDIDVQKLINKLQTDPLADGSTPEVLVDNLDKENVTVTGNWNTIRGGYVKNKYALDQKDENASISFHANIAETANYRIYFYIAEDKALAEQLSFEIFDGKSKKQVKINKSDIKSLGLASGEWVDLGEYQINKNAKSYVKVKAVQNSGRVIADAVIWKKVK
ncbi:FAD-dependent oxidoreductase [Sphingobacterium sp. UBA6645]|uniref:FAD-dependent oxidoreductase n=1 Tax=Sphingobacterium sp. UBA6645 TaxID=1947511 RepID=UPI0025DCA681|nr:FAD-dependent oxidoreductase [Sphingobacterium sp. UBA6645]